MFVASWNDHFGTVANFQPCAVPDRPADLISRTYRRGKGWTRTGSYYWRTADGLIRQSNHWGFIKGSTWLFDGSACHGEVKTGYCPWKDFTREETTALV